MLVSLIYIRIECVVLLKVVPRALWPKELKVPDLDARDGFNNYETCGGRRGSITRRGLWTCFSVKV